MTTCAITGSNGILGRRIKKFLPFKFYEFKNDITNYSAVKKWVEKRDFDIVIHLAAIVPTNKVEKNYIKDIRETTTPHADCTVVDNPKETIEGSVHHFSGTIRNDGTLRADFVKIVFTVSSDNMETVARDSVYVTGDKMKFKSGVISDTSLNPGNSGNFSIAITIPDSILGEYFTHKVRWIELD